MYLFTLWRLCPEDSQSCCCNESSKSKSQRWRKTHRSAVCSTELAAVLAEAWSLAPRWVISWAGSRPVRAAVPWWKAPSAPQGPPSLSYPVSRWWWYQRNPGRFSRVSSSASSPWLRDARQGWWSSTAGVKHAARPQWSKSGAFPHLIYILYVTLSMSRPFLITFPPAQIL